MFLVPRGRLGYSSFKQIPKATECNKNVVGMLGSSSSSRHVCMQLAWRPMEKRRRRRRRPKKAIGWNYRNIGCLQDLHKIRKGVTGFNSAPENDSGVVLVHTYAAYGLLLGVITAATPARSQDLAPEEGPNLQAGLVSLSPQPPCYQYVIC